MSRRAKTTSWVNFHRDGLLCFRCGATEKMFPVPLSKKRLAAMKLVTEAFSEEHAACEETERSPSRQVPKTPREWLDGYDTGLSAEVICLVLSGEHAGDLKRIDDAPAPSDPADFGRCHRLLGLFPGWRERLPEVAIRFPASPWPALVGAWDELTALYEAELPSGTAPKLYARMKQLRGEETRA